MAAKQKTALYLGRNDAFRVQVANVLKTAGYRTLFDRNDGGSCDLLIDNASRSATDIRAVLAGCGNQPGHYILISSCNVYPPTPRLRPWTETDADVCEDMHVSLPLPAQLARRREREVILLATGMFPYTILRPSILEGEGLTNPVTDWMVDRIVHGGVVVLPEGDLPTYRRVSSNDLAVAIAVCALNREAFGQIMNVTGQGMLSYWGHAAMTRDALQKELRFGYVPAWRWRSASLSLPLGETASASLIEPSRLLYNLGWRPSDELESVHSLARYSAAAGRTPDHHLIEREHRVFAEAEADHEFTPGETSRPFAVTDAQQRALRGWPGQPGSLSLERIYELQTFPEPIVKVLAVAPGAPEERLLKGEYPQHGARVIGHNALLEVIKPGKTGIKSGAKMIPLSVLPCGEPDCPFCANGANGVLGIGCDGYGWGVCTTPPSHLLPAPAHIGMAALLANPLGSLIWAISGSLSEGEGPVWIAGKSVEAALAVWLAEDAGRPVLLVDRRAAEHPEFPVSAVEEMLQKVRQGEIAAPTLAVDFSGSCDVSWPLANALVVGSSIWVRTRPPGVPHGIHWHEIPAAPTRQFLEDAIATLVRWHSIRDLKARTGPAVPFDLYWDAFLPSSFSLPYLEEQP